MTFGCKRKTIVKIIRSKLNDWISSIKDEELCKLLKRDVIVTGGSITSMLMGDEIKDFDIYFKTKETTIAVAQYYCSLFIDSNKNAYYNPTVQVSNDGRVTIHVVSAGVAESDTAPVSQEESYENGLLEGGTEPLVGSDYVGTAKSEESDVVAREKYQPVFLSGNAITLTDKVQLVIRFYGQPADIHKNYDYIHCQNVYDYESNTLHLLPEALEATLSKNLLYTGSLYPICSLFRMRKFLDRGWRISAGEIVKMSFQISKLNLNDMEVLKEQLTGCDMVYMRNLISALEVWNKDNPDIELDSNYMMTIIDKVFNQ